VIDARSIDASIESSINFLDASIDRSIDASPRVRLARILCVRKQ